jgi:hypothetical protein
VAKTNAQLEKRKRETEKRKKTEKAVLKIAAAMPDTNIEQGSTSPSAAHRIKAPEDDR